MNLSHGRQSNPSCRGNATIEEVPCDGLRGMEGGSREASVHTSRSLIGGSMDELDELDSCLPTISCW